jgi:hypothetical protein
MALSIEPALEIEQRVCSDCGRPFSTVHGFLYEDGDAYAVYHALLQREHPSTQVALALSLGSWDEDATRDTRSRVGVRVWPEADELRMHIEDPDQSPWDDSDMFGRMLERKAVVDGALREEVLRSAEFVVAHDQRVQAHLAHA